MKKYISVILLLLITLTLGSCDLSGLEDLFGNTDGGEEEPAAISVRNNSYIVYPENTKLVLSYSDGLCNYFVYKLGQVECVPLAYHDNPQRHDGIADINYSWTDTVVTSETIRESEELLEELTISTEVGSSIEVGFEAGVSGGGGGVSAGVKTTVGTKLETKSGTEVKVTGSEAAEKELAKISEQRKEKSFVIEKSSPAGYYRYAVCATCDVYVVLECNTREKTYTYDYLTVLTEDRYDAILYSERSSISIDLPEKLSFDPEAIKGADMFGEIPPEAKTVYVELDSYMSKNPFGDTVLSSFSGEGYSYSSDSGILELKGTDDYKDITEFVIRGNYGKTGSEGNIIRDVIKNLSIRISSNHDIKIKLESLACYSVSGMPVLYSNAMSGKTVTVVSGGMENMLISTGANGNATVDLGGNYLMLEGYADLSVKGENAYGDGASGIRADIMTLNIDANLELTAGDGADGTDGAAVGNNSNGNPGFDGGDGGTALTVGRLDVIKCGNLKICGGNGGRGGDGSNGNNATLGSPKSGGKGGNGGNGGDGINVTASKSLADELAKLEGSLIEIRGGNGGDGGNGGRGGGSTKVGKGGAGGDGGYKGYAAMDSGMNLYSSNDGLGGFGGNGGSNSNDTSKDGADGADRR